MAIEGKKGLCIALQIKGGKVRLNGYAARFVIKGNVISNFFKRPAIVAEKK